jgi:2-C-methyl-D-erythritol 4-phosphate cytidylyltransferase
MILWGVVVAGGGGTRYGGLKQFALLGGRRVLDWSIAALAPYCQGIVVVVPSDLVGRDELVPPADPSSAAGPSRSAANRTGPILAPDIVVVAGGTTRSASVRCGLAALDQAATHVLIHDSVRPLASPSLVARVCDALAGGARAVVPVVPVTDTLRTADGRPVDRAELVAVQTPQGFEIAGLRAAHRHGLSATDDASLLDAVGIPVLHVAGEASNMKITEPHDLRIAEVLLHEH